MDKRIIDKIQTPCIVIDMEKTKKNIKMMQDIADNNNCKLRPHIKTHKMQLFSRLQLEYGAVGITCAKISEAEVMAEGGIEDIFIAYPLVGDFRIRRAIELAGKIKRLILSVDSLEGATALNNAAKDANLSLEIRMEVDTGAKRTGVILGEALPLAQNISQMSNVDLTGIYSFKGLIYEGEPTEDSDMAGREEARILYELSKDMDKMGIPIEEISAGSTPTAEPAAITGLLTEIRPGTYIFKDYMLYRQGIAELDEVAAHIYATVVSTPREEIAVIDGGTKTFPMDIELNTPPYFYSSYGIIEGNDDLVLTRMNEEHGIITSKNGKTGLRVGQKIKMIPIHICTAINMQNQVYLYDGHDIIEQKVDARGMLV